LQVVKCEITGGMGGIGNKTKISKPAEGSEPEV
jgi:hypothetical protein